MSCFELFKYSSISHILPHSEVDTLGIHEQNFFTHMFFNDFLHSQRHLGLLHFWFALHFLPSSLHLQPHEACFTNYLVSLIPVIILYTVF